MANPHPQPAKPQLRAALRARLDALAPERRASQSAALVRHLANWLAGHLSGGTLATFASLPHEPFLGDLPALLPTFQFALPLTGANGTMHFHRVDSPAQQLRPNKIGLLEPDPHACARVAPGELVAILCPGLGFSRTGQRLGMGGGFYDRFLVNCPRTTPRIGVTFTSQVLDSLPCDPHDAPVDFLATEAGVSACGN